MNRPKQHFSLTMVFGALLIGLTLNAAPSTDGEILDVVRTANNAEIALAELATKKSSDPNVIEFASNMIKDHRKNHMEAREVTKKARLVFQMNDSSDALSSKAESKLNELLKAPAHSKIFDKAFVDQQIAMHQSLLDEYS